MTKPLDTAPRNLFWALGKIFLDQFSTWRLLFFSVAGFAFSLSVILGTLGLMDGFEVTLKEGLRLSAGDALLTNREGFFELGDGELDDLQISGVKVVAPVVQSEAFAIVQGRAIGVLARGIESSEFVQVTGLKVELDEGQAVVGKALAQELNLKPGDALTLALAKGKESGMPEFLSFTVASSVTHGIHEKDARMVYIPRHTLQAALGVGEKSNLVLLSFGGSGADLRKVENGVHDLSARLGGTWIVKPSWQEFSGLLEAVGIEKTSIAIVLQLIVIVAVFNIAAFLITLHAQKTKEFFLLRAMGLPRKRFFSFASAILLIMWMTSCLGAIGLIWIFNFLLAHAPWLQVPGDVYVLTKLQVLLDVKNYVIVFGLALAWMALLGGLAARKIRSQSLLAGLRQEFQ